MTVQKKKIVVGCLILLTILLWVFCRVLPRERIVDYIEADDIKEIVIKKTLEDGSGVEDCCTLKLEREEASEFYGDEVLLFDYVYGDRPSIHKRYSVASPSIKDFFETMISTRGGKKYGKEP